MPMGGRHLPGARAPAGQGAASFRPTMLATIRAMQTILAVVAGPASRMMPKAAVPDPRH